MRFNIEELQEELDQMFERDRMLLTYPDDLLELWVEVYTHSEVYAGQVEELTEITTHALRDCWGSDAFVRVSLPEGMLYYCHKDGREIARVIAF